MKLIRPGGYVPTHAGSDDPVLGTTASYESIAGAPGSGSPGYVNTGAMTSFSHSDHLLRLADLAATLGLPEVSDEARTTSNRIADGRFFVACVGQFKRGKSTLIDALLDEPVLPAGVVPVTAIPTVVRFGPALAARVRLRHDAGAEAMAAGVWVAIPVSDIAQYVSEEHNPGNARGVLAVEVFMPSELLSDGMCLVDTPGLGSVFENNTLATHAFVPQIDAAIVVLGADPPVTGDELALIATVAERVRDLIFVLNKADRVSPDELRQASAFAQRVIGNRLAVSAPRIFAVSAAERLAHVNELRDWDLMLHALQRLAHGSGNGVIRESGLRAVRRTAQRLLAAVSEELTALNRSRQDAAEHIELLERAVADGERMLQDLNALFTAEQRRLSSHFAARRRAFLELEQSAARRRLLDRVAPASSMYGPRLRREMMRNAQIVAEESLQPWMASEQEEAHQAFRQAMTRFLEMAQSLVERLIASGVDEMSTLRSVIGPEIIDLDARSRFVFNYVIHVAEPASPLRFGADLILGVVAKSAFTNAAVGFLDWLLEMNSSRVQSDVEQRVDEGRRRLEQHVRRQLVGIQSRARELAVRAEKIHAEGAEAVETTVHRLYDARATIVAIADVVGEAADDRSA